MVALMMLFSSLVGLAGPMFQQRFIDNTLMSDHGSFQEVIRFTLIMAVITVLSIITRYLRSLWSAKLGAGISMGYPRPPLSEDAGADAVFYPGQAARRADEPYQ